MYQQDLALLNNPQGVDMPLNTTNHESLNRENKAMRSSCLSQILTPLLIQNLAIINVAVFGVYTYNRYGINFAQLLG